MKKIIVCAIYFCFWAHGFCQLKEIPISTLTDQHVNDGLILEDSVVKIYHAPLIEVFTFYVKFDKVFLDPKTNEMRIIGKVCGGITNCSGLPNVALFKACRNNLNILRNMRDIGESSFSQDSLEKAGFFDVRFEIKKGESLFFFLPYFYLEEFKLDKFINKVTAFRKKESL